MRATRSISRRWSGGDRHRGRHRRPVDPRQAVRELHRIAAQYTQTTALVNLRKARVVELRFFGGLSVEETAATLRVSPQTVMRDWKLARAWLGREMNDGR